jgi:hypothetical protein
MAQTFEYPDLIAGTRGTSVYKEAFDQPQDESQPWDLHNASMTQENFMWADGPRNIPLKPDTDYTLYFWADRTDNMDSADVWIIDADGGYVPLWFASPFQIPAGGGTSRGPSDSATRQTRTRNTNCASTTTARRMARTRFCAFGTSCSRRAPSPAHGHQRTGRCGRR